MPNAVELATCNPLQLTKIDGTPGDKNGHSQNQNALELQSDDNDIVAVSGPNVRVTVYDGIATVVGLAESEQEAGAIEREIAAVDGVDHVINLITW